MQTDEIDDRGYTRGKRFRADIRIARQPPILFARRIDDRVRHWTSGKFRTGTSLANQTTVRLTNPPTFLFFQSVSSELYSRRLMAESVLIEQTV